ncbi:hypothetical protein BCY89_18600 [Sphingobacterium siyangense]|jgi:transcriptional regulator with XRE-family HTH domain|uniref:HTH cro/C1-type domain-containing protein n=2 Tax=Sphingobacteriaceae TaxID=84566 RepID=A0A420FDN0_9SPHI|nr:MAG: hypothetical protein BGP15_17700 [Sphingobacterium sp. 40-24]RKF30941.1 hypothetical protein BCY89_18600 [Sphingobacterium siyangense]HAK27792.1 hypothetical protein [Sphingobacterium sp.]
MIFFTQSYSLKSFNFTTFEYAAKCHKMTNKSSKEKIALLIKNARISKGYSQQQLADLVKLNLRSVQRIEKAEVLPRAYTLNLMAVQLDLDIALLKETEPVHEILEKKVAQQTKPALNKAQKLIVSITSGILGILLISAFLSQSTSFPETSFELFLLLAVAVLIYGIVLWWTWRNR